MMLVTGSTSAVGKAVIKELLAKSVLHTLVHYAPISDEEAEAVFQGLYSPGQRTPL